MAIKTFKAIKIKSDLDRYQNNPTKIWEKIHEFLPKNNTTYRINSLLDEDTDAIITSGKLSGHVNEYFTQIGAKLAEVHLHEYSDLDEGDNRDRGYDNQDNITGKTIDLKEIIPVLKNINVTKSSAVRHMSSMVLKDAFLAVPDKLCKIYNCSLERQIFPKAWKTSMVIPVPKVRQPKYASQLRPISLLSLPGKILERIIGTRLNKYLEQNNILSPKQHGFRKGKSTTTSIVSLLTDVYNNINDSLPTYAIFLDLKKAFDTVSHLKLLNKLKKIKIAQPTLNWFRSYLEKRTQKTNVDGDISPELNVTFGVPQGSVFWVPSCFQYM